MKRIKVRYLARALGSILLTTAWAEHERVLHSARREEPPSRDLLRVPG